MKSDGAGFCFIIEKHDGANKKKKIKNVHSNVALTSFEHLTAFIIAPCAFLLRVCQCFLGFALQPLHSLHHPEADPTALPNNFTFIRNCASTQDIHLKNIFIISENNFLNATRYFLYVT